MHAETSVTFDALCVSTRECIPISVVRYSFVQCVDTCPCNVATAVYRRFVGMLTTVWWLWRTVLIKPWGIILRLMHAVRSRVLITLFFISSSKFVSCFLVCPVLAVPFRRHVLRSLHFLSLRSVQLIILLQCCTTTAPNSEVESWASWSVFEDETPAREATDKERKGTVLGWWGRSYQPARARLVELESGLVMVMMTISW